MALGAAYYTACVLRRGVYRGHQRFYARAQDGTGLLGAATRAVLTSAPTQLVRDWNNLQSSIDRDRISPMAAADYNDDTLAGYADRYYTPDSAEVPKQQRAAALPLIEQAAGTLSDGSTLVEIGAASGDVSAYVASEFPALQVVGVDLSVAAAETRYDLPNLTFRRGYALDMLEAGEIDAELVFAASTFILFTPLELARYCRALAARRVGTVILCEPTWSEYPASADGPRFSRHLELSVWHHNYAGYLTDAGYQITHWACDPYRPPGSPRPDIRITLLEARLSGDGYHL
jgi:hypothetical protein